MSHEEIAIGLGISRNTLEKHFKLELSTSAYARRMDVLVSLYRAAKKGSSSAAKAYLQNEPQLAAPPAQAGVGPAAQPAEGPKLGKKEQAAKDATTAHVGTEWGELLRPQSAPLQ